MPCVRHPLEVTGIYATDTHVWHPVLVVLDIYGHDADAVTGIYGTDTYAWCPVELLHFIAIRGSCEDDAHAVDTDTYGHDADTMNQIPMPCVRHPLEVTGIHGTDTH